jgi:tetratricopeptide (TPR) repeat protein
MSRFRGGNVPRLNWFFSAIAAASCVVRVALPVGAQALLPYSLQLNSQELEQQGIALFQDALQLVQIGQYELALPRAELAVQLAPNTYETWFVLGTLYVQQKELDKGIEILLRARSLAPEEAGIFFTLGSAYFQKGEYNTAAREIEAGLKIEPDVLEALFDLGNSYMMLKRYPESIAVYERAIAQDEKFWPAINNIGLVEYERGNLQGAIEYWDSAASLDPEAAEPQLAIAVALFAQGNTQEGLRLGEAALSLDRKYAEIAFLKENLWGDRLIADARQFLDTPQIQAFIARFNN